MSKNNLYFYRKTFKINLVIVLISLSGIFYFFPSFDFLSSMKPKIPLLQILISEAPRTGGEVDEIDIEQGLMQAFSSFNKDTTSLESYLKNEIQKDSLYSISFRQLSKLQKTRQFNRAKLGKKNKQEKYYIPEDTYIKMFENMKPDSQDQTFPFKLPDNIQRELNRKMGRDGEYFLLPQINLVELFSNFKKNQGPENIGLENILRCENHLYILDTLWIDNPLTASQIYHKKEIRKKNTVMTLINSLTILQKNGLIKSSEDSRGDVVYHPTQNIKSLLELINDFIARNSSEKGKEYDRLIAIQSRIILAHDIY